uniref:Rho-GAP domain-containing protein n=1 Tax=Periophthalmus magnuspinnatus TaxID=409849 RepID=A0A3B3ZU52_9GOBI
AEREAGRLGQEVREEVSHCAPVRWMSSRHEFCSEACPDLTKEVYLQDIHCVGSLCKLYFRELPNPLLTYELYTKFTVSLMCGEKYATLPISGTSGPMKLMSLEEAQARSLSPNHPVHKERQRENSLPDPTTAQLYHTVIDLDSKYGHETFV